MPPESLGSLYSCQAAFLGTRTWDRQPLVDGFCSDPSCSCSHGVYPLGVRP